MPEAPKPGPLRISRGSLFLAGVVAWVALLLWVPDLGWLGLFERGPTLIHLGLLEEADLPSEVEALPPGSIRIAGRRGEATVLMLGQLGRDPLPDYALVVRAGAGPAFTILLQGRGGGKPVRKIRIAERSSTREYRRVLHGAEMPSPVRISLYHRNPRDADVLALEIRELAPAWRWVEPVAGWLPGLILLGAGWRWRALWRSWLSNEPGRFVRSDALAAATVAALCLAAFQSAPVAQLLDGKFAGVVGHRLLNEGTLALPSSLAEAPDRERPYQVQPVGERYYHFFPHVPMVLNAPWIGFYDLLGVEALDGDGRYVRANEIQVLRAAAAGVGALLCALLYLLARIWLHPGPALILTGLFAFGSQVFSTISRPWWTHGWAATLLTAALLALLYPRWRDRTAAVVLGGLLLFGAFTCRPPMALSVMAVGALFLWRERSRVGWLVVGGLAGATAFAAYSWWVYRAVLPPYFLASHFASGRFRGENLVSSYPEALLGTLFSPGRGFFVFVPLSFAILVGVVWLWRRLDDRGLAAAGIGVFLVHWHVVSSFQTWWGGKSFGPRFFSDVLPWFFVLGAMVWASWIEARRSGERRRPVLAVLLLLAAAMSLFVNIRGATERATFVWGGHQDLPAPRTIFRRTKLWDWRYPQFMAGLIPPPEGGSVEDDEGGEEEEE